HKKSLQYSVCQRFFKLGEWIITGIAPILTFWLKRMQRADFSAEITIKNFLSTGDKRYDSRTHHVD
ncbi:MAG: hypothetical protein ACFFD4_39650, partial [Candidatus Odinarchaeota archaeon]